MLMIGVTPLPALMKSGLDGRGSGRVKSPSTPRWDKPILFDSDARSALRAGSPGGRSRAATASDFGYAGLPIYAIVVEAGLVKHMVAMWFGLLDEKNSSAMITQLADSDQQTDWGMRIISDRSPKFSGGGYHYGSVWPLFTGWAAVGEYRYHRPHPAYGITDWSLRAITSRGAWPPCRDG